jgi:F-type H+-transporting ATPase subunit alpha
VSAVKRFQADFVKFMRAMHQDQLQEIAQKKILSEDLKGRLKASCQEFRQGFSVELAA